MSIANRREVMNSMTIIEKNYKTLEKMQFLATMRENNYVRLKRFGMKDLHLNKIRDDGKILHFSIAHYDLDGDSIKADPDMEIIADWNKRIVMPAAFQDDREAAYKVIENENITASYSNDDLVQNLSEFLDRWLQTIGESDYTVANRQ